MIIIIIISFILSITIISIIVISMKCKTFRNSRGAVLCLQRSECLTSNRDVCEFFSFNFSSLTIAGVFYIHI